MTLWTTTRQAIDLGVIFDLLVAGGILTDIIRRNLRSASGRKEPKTYSDPDTVGMCSCVTCRKLILETYAASFDENGYFQIHEVPAGIAFSKHDHQKEESRDNPARLLSQIIRDLVREAHVQGIHRSLP